MADEKRDKKPEQSGLEAPGQARDAGAAQSAARPMDCSGCEASLADALDGKLGAEDQKAFEEHAAHCAACGPMVQDARRGLAWLEILKQTRPEPPARLLANILAQTSGQASGMAIGQASIRALGNIARGPASAGGMQAWTGAVASGKFESQPRISSPGLGYPTGGTGLPAVGLPVKGLPAWARAGLATVMQPRLAMTAAMAFFSISLTLNLMGVRLSELKASDLQPSSLRRQFYETNARMVRNLDNLRVVYEVEARVSDLRRASEPVGSDGSDRPIPAPKEQNSAPEPKQSKPKGDGGTSRREDGRGSKNDHAALGAHGAMQVSASPQGRSIGKRAAAQGVKTASFATSYGTASGAPSKGNGMFGSRL